MSVLQDFRSTQGWYVSDQGDIHELCNVFWTPPPPPLISCAAAAAMMPVDKNICYH